MEDLSDRNLLQSKSFINGQWHSSNSHFTVISPATMQVLTNVEEVTTQQLSLAVASATSAQKQWQQATANERSKALKQWLALIEENITDLALILTREQGKTLSDAKAEIRYGASFIEWFSEEAKRVYGDTIPSSNTHNRISVIKQPIGVVSAITPWNFPNAMITRKAAAALAAGCSFIVKPAAETPLSALALAYLADKAGLPKGLFNVVVGADAQHIGEVLTTHPNIAKFTFTGSTHTGKLLAAQCISTVKKVSLELGGNAPFIVFDDANIDNAIEALVSAKFRNCGQTCISPNRIYLHEDIAQQFTEKLSKCINTLQQGNGEEKTNDIACLINLQAAEKIHNLVNKAVKNGANIVTGGLVAKPDSAFYPPTVLNNVTHGDEITQQEIFGPVLPLITFKNTTQVIEQANDTPYGLAAYFFSQNINCIYQVSEALNYGMVGINDTAISTTSAPFGGIKHSGYGREGSKYGLDDYLTIKYICLGNIGTNN
ncbi:MAG: NAD-dependent succinate-semialdehyde dehydrogenase [Thalassotalea sp.]